MYRNYRTAHAKHLQRGTHQHSVSSAALQFLQWKKDRGDYSTMGTQDFPMRMLSSGSFLQTYTQF